MAVSGCDFRTRLSLLRNRIVHHPGGPIDRDLKIELRQMLDDLVEHTGTTVRSHQVDAALAEAGLADKYMARHARKALLLLVWDEVQRRAEAQYERLLLDRAAHLRGVRVEHRAQSVLDLWALMLPARIVTED